MGNSTIETCIVTCLEVGSLKSKCEQSYISFEPVMHYLFKATLPVSDRPVVNGNLVPTLYIFSYIMFIPTSPFFTKTLVLQEQGFPQFIRTEWSFSEILEVKGFNMMVFFFLWNFGVFVGLFFLSAEMESFLVVLATLLITM